MNEDIDVSSTLHSPRRSSPQPKLVAVPPSGQWRKRRLRDRVSPWAAISLSLVAAVVGAAIGLRDASVKQAAPLACETAIVSQGPIAGTLRLPGHLAVEKTVRIGSSEPGLVVAVNAAPGTLVAKGQVLARLDDARQRAAVAGADAQLSSAEVLALRAERELRAEMDRLQAQGLLPALPPSEELLEGKAGDAQLEVLHDAAQIDRREQELALAERLLSRRVVRAPIGGIVLARNIEPGESIPASPPGPPLFVIGSDPRRLRLEVEVDERYLSAVLPGPVSFVVPAYGSYAFSGTIRQLDLSRVAARCHGQLDDRRRRAAAGNVGGRRAGHGSGPRHTVGSHPRARGARRRQRSLAAGRTRRTGACPGDRRCYERGADGSARRRYRRGARRGRRRFAVHLPGPWLVAVQWAS